MTDIEKSKPNFVIKLDKIGRECSVFIGEENISSAIMRVVIDAKASEMTKVWIQLSPIRTKIEIEKLENVKIYKLIPEDFPFKLKDVPKDEL